MDGKTPNHGTTTVLGYEQPVSVDVPTEGMQLGLKNPTWVTVEVKVCNEAGGTIVISQAPWSLGFPDDTRVESLFISATGLPKPEYPASETSVRAGDCLRGKIPFIIETGQRPDRIIYETMNTPTPVEWAVPKA
jgi:hypothetical protein